jgi:hypothetical protein
MWKNQCLFAIKNIFMDSQGWWLTPVILETQEAEIRRIKV